ncbi:hypothetical protein FJT64_021759 [Amphibalanus amphitrite]|uniref:Uncharacterized protein n=1 Tax=Amphibalanus amphitrite TaxID=1232801 RepID=A0A6A4WT19_AMPAM|nr:hypothetical protein FJT64_021759 [Amphibalanus amphitrite]
MPQRRGVTLWLTEDDGEWSSADNVIGDAVHVAWRRLHTRDVASVVCDELHAKGVNVSYVRGYTAGGMGGHSAGDWSAMLAAAVRLKTESVWPSYAVVSVGGPALLPRPDGQARRRRLQEGREPSPVPPYRNAPTAAATVIASTETFVRALQLQVPGIRPVIESVVPLQDASRAGLIACRELSESLRLVAKDNGALFLDVEVIVRRHLAGSDAQSPRPAGGTQRPAERPAGDVAAQPAESAAGPAAPPMEVEVGGGDGGPDAAIRAARMAARNSLAAAETADSCARVAASSAEELAEALLSASEEATAARVVRVAADAADATRATGKAVKAAAVAVSAATAAAAAAAATATAAAATVAAADATAADAAATAAAAASAVNVPWASGWVPGRPPPVSVSAPSLSPEGYESDGVHLTAACYAAVRRELWRIIVAEFKAQ